MNMDTCKDLLVVPKDPLWLSLLRIQFLYRGIHLSLISLEEKVVIVATQMKRIHKEFMKYAEYIKDEEE